MSTMTSPALLEHSLENALALIERADGLSDITRAQWLSSIRQIAQWLDRSPALLPARWTALRFPVDRLHHARLGISAKTLQNNRANLKAALRFLRSETDAPTRGAPLLPVWAALRDRINDRGVRARLYGLMRYCSAKAIIPDQMTTDVVERYLAYRVETSSLAGGIAAHRSIARWWNACVDQIETWPQQRLAVPDLPPKETGPAWEDFPVRLQEEVQSYLASLTRVRRSPSGKRLRPSQPSTIETRRREIIAFARQACRIGIAPGQLDSLGTLFSPDTVVQVIEAYWTKDGEEPGTYTIDLGWKVTSIARQTQCLDDAALEKLDELRFELESYRREGMTETNLNLVREVLSGPIWSEVIRLPYRLMEEARRLRSYAPVKAALRAQLAVAIGLLTVAPVRCGNLVRTRIGENLIRPAGPNSPFWLVFPHYDVKNRIKLEFPLSPNLTALIEEYLRDHWRVLLRGSRDQWLFPGEAGSFKTPSMFSVQITAAVEKATGLHVRAHQFRHAAAALILRKRPGDYEFARRVLGHRSLTTTTNFYIGLEGLTSSERFGQIVSEHLRFEGEDA
jgi:integrase